MVLLFGGASRDRTDDLLLAKQALSQLSYGPIKVKLVGLGGLEPPTSRLSSARSNQLSYKPRNHTQRETPASRRAFGHGLVIREERETKAAEARFHKAAEK